MGHCCRFLLVCLAAASSLLAHYAQAEALKPTAAARDKFVRISRNASGKPLALETAIVKYAPIKPDRAGLAVDLIGAVHVGERAYYEALNKAFEDYDVVLYELVAPPGTKVVKGSAGAGHPVRVIQDGLKNILELEHQLEWIDYAKPNLVHADMSPADFARSMQERGDSLLSIYFRMMGESMARQATNQAAGRSSDLQLMLALFDKNRALALKQIMAEQFLDLEASTRALEGPKGSTIISERNKVALKGLSEQIAAGKKRIAVFYGAGHFPDMEARLIKEFGLQRTGERWMAAWNLEAPPKGSKPRAPAAEQAPQPSS